MRRVILHTLPPLLQRRAHRASLLALAVAVSALALAYDAAGAQLSVSYSPNPELIDPGRCVADCFEVTHAYSAPPYVSRDVERTTTLLYRSNRAKPIVTVNVWARHPGAPDGSRLLMQAYRPGGTLVTWTHGTTNLYFWPKPDGGWSRLMGQIDASTWGTMRHQLTVIVSTVDASGAQIASQTANITAIVVDGQNSPFGAGFGLVGYQRLHAQHNGYLVADGSGAASFFSGVCDVWSACTFTSPLGDFSTLFVNGTGYYIRRYPDGTEYRFEGGGLPVDVTDRFGNRTTYGHRWNSYYGGYVLEGITDPAGAYTWFYYWEPNPYGWKAGYIAEIHAPGGRKTVYAPRADNGNLDHYRDPNWNLVALLQYDGAHRLTQVTDANGGIWNYEYGTNNSSVSRVLAPSVTVNGQAARPQQRFGGPGERLFEHQASQGGSLFTNPVAANADTRAFATDPNGNTTYFEVSTYGVATKTEDPVGGVSTAWHDEAGRPTRATSISGHITRYLWEASRLRTVIDSTTSYHGDVVRQVSIDYDAFDQPRRIYGHTTERCFEYDATKTSRPLKYSRIGSCTAPATSYVWTADGRLSSVTDPGGHTTTYSYATTGLQNQNSVTAPGSRTTSYGRDGYGRVISVTDPKGYSGTSQFDLLNQVQSTVGPQSDTTRFQYDALGRVRRVTDARGQYYEYQRNALGWVEAQLDATPSHAAERFAYDSAGNVRSGTNRRGQVVRFTYDGLNRVKSRVQDAEGGAQTTYAYDPAGRWMVAANGESTDTIYLDKPGRPERNVTRRPNLPDRAVASFYQDPWGERERMCVGASAVCYMSVSFQYDAARRLSGIVDHGSHTTAIGVNGDELPTSVTFPSGMQQSTTFSSIHGRSATQYSVWGVNEAFYRGYAEDPLGLVTRKQHSGDRRRDYAYHPGRQIHAYSDYEVTTSENCYPNEWGQIVCETVQNENLLATESYYYDRVGNRTDNGASTNDPANRLSAFAGYSLSYDADGNLTRKYKPGVVDWTYQWNSLGQLANVYQNGAHVANFGYDGFGRRVRKWTSAAGTRHYLWDGDQLAAEMDGSGTFQVAYTYYPGIDRLHSVTTGNATYYAAVERPGENVVGLIRRSDNAVVAQYGYRPFGLVEQDNTTIANSLRWQGLQYDRETGLYYVRSRYFDPELTRFVSEDPIGLEGGINLYVFAGNDPVNSRDPYGLCPLGPTVMCGSVEVGEAPENEPSPNFLNPNERGGNAPRGGGPGGRSAAGPRRRPAAERDQQPTLAACATAVAGLALNVGGDLTYTGPAIRAATFAVRGAIYGARVFRGGRPFEVLVGADPIYSGLQRGSLGVAAHHGQVAGWEVTSGLQAQFGQGNFGLEDLIPWVGSLKALGNVGRNCF